MIGRFLCESLSFQQAPIVHILGIGNRVQVAPKLGFQDVRTSFQLCHVVLWEGPALERVIVAVVFWPNVSKKCHTRLKFRKLTSSCTKNRGLGWFIEAPHEFSGVPRTCLSSSKRGKAQSQVVFSPNILEKCHTSKLANNMFLRPPSHKRKAAAPRKLN